MKTEQDVPPRDRFLWLQGLVSPAKRSVVVPGLPTFDPSISRICFVGCSYANLDFPIKFDTVFDFNSTDFKWSTSIKIVAAVVQTGYPLKWIPENCDSICLLEFPCGIPSLIDEMPVADSKIGRGIGLAICSSEDFSAVIKKSSSISRRCKSLRITTERKEQLIRQLNHQKSRFRWIAANELGWFQASESVDALIRALKDPVWLVRLHAAKALGRIGDKRALMPLEQAISDTCLYVQRRVVITLGDLGDERIIPIILKAVQENKELHNQVYSILLKFMGGYASYYLIDAARGNGRTWNSSNHPRRDRIYSKILMFLLKFSALKMKARIIWELGNYGDESVIQELEGIKNKPQDWSFYKGRFEAIGKIQCRKYERYLP